MSLKQSLKDIGFLFKLLKKIKEVRKSMAENKEGKKTSEFVVLIADIVLMVAAVGVGKLSVETAVIAGVVLTAVYNVGRIIAKKTSTKVDDQIVAKLGELLPKFPKRKK